MELLLILWSIIKVIVYIVLGILLLLFLLLLLMLFSPTKYALSGAYTKEITGEFDIKWILGAIHLWGRYQNEKLEIAFSIFGYCIYGGNKKQKNNKSVAKKEETVVYTRERQPQLTETKEVEKEENLQSQSQPKQKQHRRVKATEAEEKIQQQKEKKPKHKKTKTQKNKNTKKQSQQQALNKDYFLHMKQKKQFLKAILLFCKRMAKGVLPKNVYLKATIGTGDPALTGYLLAVAGVAKMKFGKSLQITGDFKQMTVQDVFLDIQGSIFLIYLLYAVIRLLCVKTIWQTIKLAWKGNR